MRLKSEVLRSDTVLDSVRVEHDIVIKFCLVRERHTLRTPQTAGLTGCDRKVSSPVAELVDSPVVVALECLAGLDACRCRYAPVHGELACSLVLCSREILWHRDARLNQFYCQCSAVVCLILVGIILYVGIQLECLRCVGSVVLYIHNERLACEWLDSLCYGLLEHDVVTTSELHAVVRSCLLAVVCHGNGSLTPSSTLHLGRSRDAYSEVVVVYIVYVYVVDTHYAVCVSLAYEGEDNVVCLCHLCRNLEQ